MQGLTVLFLLASSTLYASGIQNSDALRLEAGKLEQTIHDHPENAFAHYQLGIVYRELGNNRSATTNLKAAIQGGFANLAVRLNLIESASSCGHSALALQTAKQVLSLPLQSSDVLLRVGRVLFDHLYYKEALHAFQLAEAITPSAFEPRFRAALTYYLLENYAGALDMLKPAGVRAFPASAEAASLEASVDASAGHFEAAVSLLRDTIASVPKNPHAYVNLALIEIDRGNMSQAKTLLEQFRSLDASNAKVFYRIKTNFCPEIAGASKRLSSSPENGEFYDQLAEQLEAGFNFLSAAALAHLAQANEGNSARVLMIAGESCLNQDPAGPDAALLLREATEADDNLHKAYFLLGRAYTRQGRVDDAIKAYRKAADLHPEASYYVSLGKALGKPLSAVAEYQQALALDSAYAPAHLELGRAYVEIGESAKARMELEKAIELEPDFYEADYLLGRLFHQLGDEEKSHRLLKEFAETKSALMEQAVIGAGYVGDGR